MPTYLVEMTTDGKVVWEWRVWEHLDPVEDAITAVAGSTATNGPIANGVSEMPDGNLLLSFRNISTVIMINRQTGEIVWKLGRAAARRPACAGTCSRTATCCSSTTGRIGSTNRCPSRE